VTCVDGLAGLPDALETIFPRTQVQLCKVDVYFCDLQSPWQRGTDENMNRLLRQYFPKGTTLSQYSQADLDRIALRLNQRPGKTLGFQTPAAILETGVAHTEHPTYLDKNPTCSGRVLSTAQLAPIPLNWTELN